MAKNEVMDPTTGEVLPAAMLKKLQESAKKAQTFDQSALIIPRLKILQDLSNQARERSDQYVPGAKPGMILNTVTNDLCTSLTFIPAYFTTRFVAWKPRPDGGLVDQDFPEEKLSNMTKDLGSKWLGQVERDGKMIDVEVIETPEWAGVAIDENGKVSPVVIDFAITKAKAARKIATTIELTEIMVGDEAVVPASFMHEFTLSSAIEQSGDNEWFGWKVSHNGFGENMRAIERAEKLRDSMAAGDAVAAAPDAH